MKKYLCEFLGTCVLVLFGCGVAVLTKADLVATSLAFGLSIVAVAYVIGNASGAHVNPAVTFAMWIDKRISGKDFILYICSQFLGAFVGSLLLMFIISSTGLGDYRTVGLGANGYGVLSANNISMIGALVVEIILTFVFVLAVLGVTKEKKNSTVAPIVIGLTLTLVHLIGIKLTGTSVNPARSLAPALILASSDVLSQVWVFVVGPFVGAAFAALVSFFIDLEPVKADVVEVFDIEKVEAEELKNSKKNEVIIEKVVKAEEKKEKKVEKTSKETEKKEKTSKPKTTKTNKSTKK